MQHDELTEARLREALGDAGAGLALCVFDCIDSTNSEAKRRALGGAAEPTLIVAAAQTAGRGRMGRSFFSPDATGAYFSLLFFCGDPSRSLPITGAASVAVMRAIRRLTGRQASIKWVNDLYLDGKKICGILTEAQSVAGMPTAVVVGIGINLTTAEFPPELAEKAGSIGTADLSRTALIAEVVRELLPFVKDPADTSWLSDYRAHSCVIGKPISWVADGVTARGEAIGINDRGELSVRLPDGSTDILRTGEISLFLDTSF